MILEKPLFLCMVNFSNAFYLVHKNILFFKLTNAGVHGKMIET